MHIASAFKKDQIKAPRLESRSSVITYAAGGDADPYANKYPSWDSIYKQLTEKYNLRSLTADEASIMVDEGKAVLLDIRLADDYTESHPAGSVSCPAFRVIKTDGSGGFQSMLKMLVMRANGVNPTEANPEFPAMAAAAAGSDKIVILACEAGGTPFATPNFPTGKASRSLKACWKLIYSGALPAERVMHLSGGVLAWFKEGLPMQGENEYDTSKAGRTNNVVTDVKK
ncbi:hypothetical protein Ndes2526A_g01326 [Nannochloris sp. 'desiccata']